MGDDAQIHVLEVITVAGILLVSLYFVKSFDFSPPSVISRENKLETLGVGILSSLEVVPDSSEKYNNLLARYASNTNANDLDEFTDYINSSLPQGTLYEISVINISNMSKYSDATVGSSTTILYPSPIKIGTETYASRAVVIDGYVYKVILEIYYILR